MVGTGQRGKGCIQMNPRNRAAWSRNGEKQCEQVKKNVLVTPRSLLSSKLRSVIPRSLDSSLYAIKNCTESHSIWGNHQEQNRMHSRRNTWKGQFLQRLSVPGRIRIARQDNGQPHSCLHAFTSFLYPRKQRKEQKTEPENAARFSPSHSSRMHREVCTDWRCFRCGKEVHREGTCLLCTWRVSGPSDALLQ